MTKYNDEELSGDWEFKIVRSNSSRFRKIENFQQLLEEESIAGWQLIEKLDDSRVRFKRPPSARKKDYKLPEGIDPYRSTVGMNEAAIGIIIGVSVMLVIAGILLAIYLAKTM